MLEGQLTHGRARATFISMWCAASAHQLACAILLRNREPKEARGYKRFHSSSDL